MIFLLIYRNLWNGASQSYFTAATSKDVFSLCLVWKLNSLWRRYVFICVYIFLYIYLCKGYHNNWKLESLLCWRLVLVTCMSPDLTSLLVGRRKKSVFCLQIVLTVSSPQFKHAGKVSSPSRYFGSSPGLLSICSIKSLSTGTIGLPPGFHLKKSTTLSKVLSPAVSQSWKIRHQNRSIPCDLHGPGGSLDSTRLRRGEAVPLHWAQTCTTVPSTASISPVSPQAWRDQDLPPQRSLH